MEEIGDYMATPALRIEADDSAQDAAAYMEGNHVGSLVVTEVGEDIGIVTERDLSTKVVAKGIDADEIKVREIMTQPILTMDRYLPVEEANLFMQKNKIRHLGVTEEEKIVGVISVRDLVSYFSREFKMQE